MVLTVAVASATTLPSCRSAATNQLLHNPFIATQGFFTVSSSSPSNQTPFDWAELPYAVVYDVKNAISKNKVMEVMERETSDVRGQLTESKHVGIIGMYDSFVGFQTPRPLFSSVTHSPLPL